MSVIKLIRSLLKKPIVEASQLLVDWPPEGSMHFIDVTQTSQEFARFRRFPVDFKIYEFGSNWAEQESDAIPLAHEVIKQLCENRVVLTDIESTPEVFKKKKYTREERFTVRYHRFLRKTHPQVSVYAENERKLDILTTGFNAEALLTYEETDTTDYCYFEFYLFPKDIVPTTAQQAWGMVRNNEYDMQLWMNDSPVGLEVIFNPRTVDIDFVQSVVKDVCEKHTVRFSNPPKKPNISS